MSDDCPCPQCQEGDKIPGVFQGVDPSPSQDRIALVGRRQGETCTIDLNGWFGRLRAAWDASSGVSLSSVSLSESRVFAMLDEDGGGWQPTNTVRVELRDGKHYWPGTDREYPGENHGI